MKLFFSPTPKATLFFLDGPGGTGKTFVYNTILAKIRSIGNIALAVASSGIAAELLEGGRTAHSRFKIPIPILETSTCNISIQSSLAELIRNASIIIWDEAPMMHRYVFECVHRTFSDIMKNENLEEKLFYLEVTSDKFYRLSAMVHKQM